MKKWSSLFIGLCLLMSWNVQAQRKMRQPKLGPRPHYELKDIHFKPFLPAAPRAPFSFGQNTPFQQAPMEFQRPGGVLQGAKVSRDALSRLPIAISGKVSYQAIPAAGRNALEAECFGYLEAIKTEMRISSPQEEFVVTRQETDMAGYTHLRMEQRFQGLPVHGAEIIIHFKDGQIYFFNGRYQATPALSNLVPALSSQAAIERCQAAWGLQASPNTASEYNTQLMGGPATAAQLLIYVSENGARLAYKVSLRPSLLAFRVFFIDAHSGEILHQRDEVCQINGGKHEHTKTAPQRLLPPDGPATAIATDLLGVQQTINTYQKGNTFYMIDASRSMFNPIQSNIPNDPAGVIWTINAQNTSPENDNFSTVHLTSGNNTWANANAVSAHFNAGKAFVYFKQTFSRNSINGQGGNIISLINVAEQNGQPLDNAYWNGAAMFYGNGSEAFSFPLAKSLDVAGHEMSHGVIQNTANLEYYGESGAINESFADVFGAMIDRNDWLIGEDIVNDNVFVSGALRNLQDPHNGGNNLNDEGYQPAHFSEKYLGSADNAGVHINSGIPNRAFYLFANQVGKEAAEQVYYLALSNYLTRSSQFIDLRNAIIQAATELHGANSSQVTAATNAFSTVGIGAGQGGNYTEDLDNNPGNEYILFTDTNQSSLFVLTPAGNIVFNPLSSVGPISKPSITDDGSIVVYIAGDHTMRGVIIDWQQGTAQSIIVSEDPIWDNVAISKDGNRIAALTNEEDNRIFIFDLVTDLVAQFELYNPTYAQDIETGDVAYADVLEWDFTGERIMYDALNRIDNNTGTIEYWDIGFIRVWNNSANTFGDGFISKLFNGLPEDTGVGDPTFSKNSPHIIALDFFDTYNEEFYILGVNLETNTINTILENSDLGYPSYSIDDSYLVFDAYNNFGDNVIGFIELETDKITPASNASVLINTNIGARWGVLFANGDRVLTDVINTEAEQNLQVYPNPFSQHLNLKWKNEIPDQSEVLVSDALGKIVFQGTLKGTQLQLGHLPAGQYWLRVAGQAQPISIVKMP